MDQNVEKKIKQAEKMKKKPWLIGMFVTPDYIGAGELLYEAAEETENRDEKIRLLKEAGTTFVCGGGEYGTYRASECYRRICEMLENSDPKEATENCILCAEHLERARRYLVSGQTYTRAAEIILKSDRKRAIELYMRSYEAYRRDGGCKYHMKDVGQKCLMLQLKDGDVDGAIRMLGNIDVKYGKLLRQILCVLDGREEMEEDLEKEENELVMGLLNKKREEWIEMVERFRSDNYVPEHGSMVFDLAIKRMSPEHDIC